MGWQLRLLREGGPLDRGSQNLDPLSRTTATRLPPFGASPVNIGLFFFLFFFFGTLIVLGNSITEMPRLVAGLSVNPVSRAFTD